MTKIADPIIRKGHMGMCVCVFLFKMYEFTSDSKYYDLIHFIPNISNGATRTLALRIPVRNISRLKI